MEIPEKEVDPKLYYEIHEQIGLGATSLIYRGVDKTTQKTYAIKAISSEDHDLNLINVEINMLRKFHNIFIISYHHCFYFDTKYWIFLEYCSGGSIFDILAIINRTLRENEIKFIVSCVLLGLQYIHEQGYIHKDIKTHNMLLSSTGIVKLCDFGITASIETAQSEGNVDVTGTAHYMSPELINGAIYDTRADIWAVGISIIELCEGIVPNARIHKRRVLGSITEGPTPTLKVPSNWSPTLTEFLTCCLQKHSSQRFNCSDLLNHQWITTNVEECRKLLTGSLHNEDENRVGIEVLFQLYQEVVNRREFLLQESLKAQKETELRLQREKEEREAYQRKLKQEEELRRRQAQLEEEKRENERELERQRKELLRRYAHEAEMKLLEMEKERNCVNDMETEDYYSYLREDNELQTVLTKAGWMKKRAYYMKWWNQRWVSVSRGILRYYLSNDSSDLMIERGIFILSENTRLIINSNEQHHLSRHSFILLNPPLTPSSPLPRLSLLDEEEEEGNWGGGGGGEGWEGGDRGTTTVIPSFDIQNLNPKEIFYFKCQDENEKNEWLEMIRRNIVYRQQMGHDFRYLRRVHRDFSMRGWVKKKGIYGFWNRRYFILEGNHLRYYLLPPHTSNTTNNSRNTHNTHNDENNSLNELPRGHFKLSSTCHVTLLDSSPPTLLVYERYQTNENLNWEVSLRGESLTDILIWTEKIQKQINILMKSHPL